MYKSKNKVKLVQKIFSIHPNHIEMIDRFLEEKAFSSGSDVVRQAISMFHDKTFPDYVYRETAAGELKRKQKEEQDAFERITDKEYCTDILKSPVLVGNEGAEWTLLHTIGQSLIALPVNGIKEYLKKHEDILNFHLTELNKHSVVDQIDTATKETLKIRYGIVIE